MILKVYNKLINKASDVLCSLSYCYSQRYNSEYDVDLDLSQINDCFPGRNESYRYFHHYFWNKSPHWLMEHRSFFKKENRGFGEDAFHAMWFLLLKTYQPRRLLEIGVYRGQTLSLWLLVSDMLRNSVEVHGISPFSSAGDSVSKYRTDINYWNDTFSNIKKFSNKEAILHQGYSTDEKMKRIISSNQWDVVYIDGCHDYETVWLDFKNCSENLSKRGIIVLDDASLYGNYKALKFSTKGHPGPSKVADRILEEKDFKEILAVGHNRVFKRR